MSLLFAAAQGGFFADAGAYFQSFWRFLERYGSMFLQGTLSTLQLAAFGVVIGVVGGVLLAFLRLSRVSLVRFLGTAYVEIFRGTPMMVQVFFAAFAIPQILNIQLSNKFLIGAIVLGMNSAAYVAEIVRAGIQSVDKGQMEAARSLGMGNWMAMFHIILPQAIRNILPALGNEFVVIIKESSVLQVIGVPELMKKSNEIWTASYRISETLMITALIYFILTFSMSKLVAWFERRLGRSKRIRKADLDAAKELEAQL